MGEKINGFYRAEKKLYRLPDNPTTFRQHSDEPLILEITAKLDRFAITFHDAAIYHDERNEKTLQHIQNGAHKARFSKSNFLQKETEGNTKNPKKEKKLTLNNKYLATKKEEEFKSFLDAFFEQN